MSEENKTSSNQIYAEIVSIGDEITTGAILDTNSQYLSQSLSEVGVKTLFHTTISDDMDSIVSALAVAMRRADVTIVTGGLGPTQDDLTRQAVADALGVDLVFDPESLERVKRFFINRNREMPKSNEIQAYFPRGAQIIANPNGTAPGFFVEQDRLRLPDSPECVLSFPKRPSQFFLASFPGVPAELKEMWKGENGRDAVVRFINRVTGGKPKIYQNKLIHSFGAGESAIEEKLRGLISRDRRPLVGITAKDSVITLRIFAEGESSEECERQIEEISRFIYSKIGDFIFGEDEDTYARVISHNLRAQCRKVGVFEWGARGALASCFEPDVLAFGRLFGGDETCEFKRLFGDSSQTPEEKKLRSVNRETFGSRFYVLEDLSDELRELCERERRGRNVDYFLAVGPFPDSSEWSDATVDVAFVDYRNADKPILHRETFTFSGHPAIRNTLYTNQALDLLRRYQ